MTNSNKFKVFKLYVLISTQLLTLTTGCKRNLDESSSESVESDESKAEGARLRALAFPACLEELRGNARQAQVMQSTIDSATSSLEPNDADTFLDKQQEFTTPVWDYLAGLVDEERVGDGLKALEKYGPALAKASELFSVDAATIVAVWGVESDYGKNLGKRSVIQSLATLVCKGSRRNTFYRKEFIAALKILDAKDIVPAEFLGSWAGAFGQTQFMPSTFLELAIDLDGDHHRNIASSAADALGSTANFLKKAGWDLNLPWGFEVKLPANFSGKSARKEQQTMDFWSKQGITRQDGSTLGSGMGALLLPAEKDNQEKPGPAFIVTSNFNAIYTYNNSESYALAISVLADRLRGKNGIQTPWPTDDLGLSRADRRKVQQLLNDRGALLGDPDGSIGAKTQAAIAVFQTAHNLPVTGRASVKLLESLTSAINDKVPQPIPVPVPVPVPVPASTSAPVP